MADKRVVVVTGASSGIGQNIAIELSGRGYAVVLCGRNKEGLETTSKQCQEKGAAVADILQISGDLLNPLEVERIVSATLGKFGRIYALINNAGFLKLPDNLETVTSEYFDEMFSVNVRAPVLLTKACMPYLEKSKGVVINISSCGSRKPGLPGIMVYGMTKSALEYFTKSVACACGPKGVRVCGVVPGLIPATELVNKALGKPPGQSSQTETTNEGTKCQVLQRPGQPQDVSNMVAYLLSDEASFITGENISVDAGFQL